MGLLGIGQRFQSVFRTVGGMKFYGQVGSIPDTSRVSNFLSARRYLRTGPKTPIQAGHVVICNGQKFIVAEHGDGFFVVPIYKHFKLFEVDEEVSWTAKTRVQDSVTGVWKDTFSGTPVTVYLSTQPHANVEDTIRVPHKTKTALCNAAVNVNDKIGSYLVKKVDFVLGIRLLDLEVIA